MPVTLDRVILATEAGSVEELGQRLKDQGGIFIELSASTKVATIGSLRLSWRSLRPQLVDQPFGQRSV